MTLKLRSTTWRPMPTRKKSPLVRMTAGIPQVQTMANAPSIPVTNQKRRGSEKARRERFLLMGGRDGRPPRGALWVKPRTNAAEKKKPPKPKRRALGKEKS